MSEVFNASGAYDPTAGEAIRHTLPQPGEIWATKDGKLFLCLKRHSSYCNILALRDSITNGTTVIPVNGVPYYTNPALVCFIFEQNYGSYIDSMTEEAFDSLIECVSEKLGISIPITRYIVEEPVSTAPAVTQSNVNHPSHYQGSVEVIDVI